MTKPGLRAAIMESKAVEAESKAALRGDMRWGGRSLVVW